MQLTRKASLTLLGIEIDNKLNFEKHITALCQKFGRQLNALSFTHKYIEIQKWKCYLAVFKFSNFNLLYLLWSFCPAVLSQKIKKIEECTLNVHYAFKGQEIKLLEITAWKVSVFGVILVFIFPHLDWMRTRITPNTDTYYAVNGPSFSNCVWQFWDIVP